MISSFLILSQINILLLIYTIFLLLIFIGMLIIGLYKEKENIIKNEEYKPKVLVILPIKGLDLNIEENLKALKDQSYDNYRLVAVVDSKEDPVIKYLEKEGIEYLISDGKGMGSGKVKAIATALEKFKDYEAYLLVDSDVRVKKDWIRKMIEPLTNKEIGLATSFPLFKAVKGFWSKVKSVWGLVGLRLIEARYTRFGWGGTLAFRRDLIDEEFIQYFRNCLSDDIALTARCKKLGLKIYYVRDAEIEVYCKEDRRSFFEWANRQTALSILGNSKVFSYGFAYYFSTNLLFLSAIILSLVVSPFYILLITPIVINAIKNSLKIKDNAFIVFLISLFINFIYLYNLINSKKMKFIIWRGNKYPLKQYLA